MRLEEFHFFFCFFYDSLQYLIIVIFEFCNSFAQGVIIIVPPGFWWQAVHREQSVDPLDLDNLQKDWINPLPADPALEKAIHKCIESLPTQPKRALTARIRNGHLPDRDLAQGVRMKLNTFLQNIVRARKLFADCLEHKGVQLAEFLHHPGQCSTGIEDVVHHQHIAPAHLKPQFLGEHKLAGFGARAVARHPHEIQSQRQIQGTDQIRQEHHSSVKQRDDEEVVAAEVPFDFAGEAADAPGYLVFRNQDE